MLTTLHLRDRIAADPLTGAWLSDEPVPLYRYALWRRWDRFLPFLLVSMLNPSTADHRKDDPTIRRVIDFAKRDGYGGIIVLNAYAFRATDPREMFAVTDPDGPLNRLAKRQAVEAALDDFPAMNPRVLIAHGNGGSEGALKTFDIFHAAGCEIVCLGRTNGGHPKHPLARGKHRIPNDAPMLPWAPGGPP